MMIFILALVLCWGTGLATAEGADRPPVAPVPLTYPAPDGFQQVGHGCDASDFTRCPEKECKEVPGLSWWSYDQTCRTEPFPTNWTGDNQIQNGKFSSLDNWPAHDDDPECTVWASGGSLHINRQGPDWPPCGVRQVFGEKGSEYLLAFDLPFTNGKGETYTDPDSSEFYATPGTKIRTLSSGGVSLYLQSKGGYSEFKNLIIRKKT